MNAYALVSIAGDGRSQVYQEVCSVAMAILTVGTKGDNCENALHHRSHACHGIYHSFWLVIHEKCFCTYVCCNGDTRPQVHQGKCLLLMVILTLGTWADNCECTLCHIAYKHSGMHAIHVYS